MLTVITFIIIFSLLIFLHELGHFLSARRFGVRVIEFGFGLPPRLFGVMRRDGEWTLVRSSYTPQTDDATIYSLNWIPFGGFVKLFGEDNEKEQGKGSMNEAPAWQRLVIVSAGVAMNVLLTVALFSVGFITGTPSVVEDDLSSRARVRDVRIQVVEVIPNSPAFSAHIAVGDTIRAMNGVSVDSINEFQNKTRSSEARPLALTIERDGASREISVTPQKLPQGGDVPLVGVGLIRTGIVSYPWYAAVFEGVRSTYYLAQHLIQSFITILITFMSTGSTQAVVSGPVGIAVLTGQVVQLGFPYVMQFAATLSLNLAILNYLPIPALDGGRVLFTLIEILRGKAVNRKWESITHTVGFALLLLLIAFVTYRDILRYGAGILQTLRSIIG
ncbi:MAG: M50 family metallopeptidase [Patescibacteria group bacterium]